MAKGWEHFSTVNDATVESNEAKKARLKRVDRIMRTTPILSEEELKKASNERYAIKMAREEDLVVAYGEKKLKSKRLIREARAIIKRREEEAKKAKEAEIKNAKDETEEMNSEKVETSM